MDYYKVIEEVLDYIEQHIEEPMDLSFIAKEHHMSKYYFHRLFTAVMGVAPNQYLLSRRLNHSLGLILHSDLSLTEIAYQLNFGNQASFIRAFKKQYEATPGQIRRKESDLQEKPVPMVVPREFKNLGGNMITDFDLVMLGPLSLKGIAFEVDLGEADYKSHIRHQSMRLGQNMDKPSKLPKYMVYSNCQPGSSKFKALVGIEAKYQNESADTDVFQIDLPPIYCAKFRYEGDLLEISQIFTSDFAHMIKLTQMNPEDNPIELIQVFDPDDEDYSHYHILVPIQASDDDPL